MKTNSDNWIYLSYPLSTDLSGYGNGDRIKIKQVRSIANGDTSNNSEFCMPVHFGTHIDFPFHFSNNGKTINNYNPGYFVFENVSLINLDLKNEISDFLIKSEHLAELLDECNVNTDLLLIRTGFCNKRDFEEYWKFGYGFGLGVAELLKQKIPRMRAVGFDLISLNSYQQREIGREAHKEFLLENEILIIEDMNLSGLLDSDKDCFDLVIVSPLYIEGSEGAPVTIFAKKR